MKNKKIIFWNTDTQRDFMEKNGALYIKNAETIKPNLKRLTEFARENNIFVVNTADYHFPGDEELSDKPDFKTTFPPHCMYDDEGYKYIEETAVVGDYNILDYRKNQETDLNLYDRNIVLTKNKFDIFSGNSHANKFLDFINPDIVIVYGVAGDFCVNYAVKGLIDKDYKVFVVIDAIKSIKENPIKDWNQLGVQIGNTEEIFKFIKEIKNEN